MSNNLFPSFIFSNNNAKFVFGKSQSLFKNNNNNLKRRINSLDYRKFNKDNCKSQVKVVNINLSEIETTNYSNINNNSNNNLINSNYSQIIPSKRQNLTISN